MSDLHTINCTVNGERHQRQVHPRKNLVDFLREDLGLKGSHLGCEQGFCGACTVELNGQNVRGCLTLAVQADGAIVRTIEGMTQSGVIADLQEAFIRRNAFQCGFCTPGMLMTSKELVETQPQATREKVREEISGNFCRCTGYHSIVDAICDVIELRKQKVSQ